MYYCYCKKVKNPTFDPWGVPHSCSQTCEKVKTCGHTCLMLCHPGKKLFLQNVMLKFPFRKNLHSFLGPCPPCPKMVTNSCYCSKSSPVSRRCSNKFWSCNKSCNKLLACKQHLCEKVCHGDNCGECSKTSTQFCKCKKKAKRSFMHSNKLEL